MRRSILLAMTVLLTAGCASYNPPPVQLSGPGVPLASALKGQVRIDRIEVGGTPGIIERFAQSQSDYEPPRYGTEPLWRVDPMDELAFSNAMEAAMEYPLKRCATGGKPLTARVLIDGLEYDDRFSSLWDGKGSDRVGGVVELVDRSVEPEQIVARVRILTSTSSGALLARLLTDRIDAIGEAFGDALCAEVFAAG